MSKQTEYALIVQAAIPDETSFITASDLGELVGCTAKNIHKSVIPFIRDYVDGDREVALIATHQGYQWTQNLDKIDEWETRRKRAHNTERKRITRERDRVAPTTPTQVEDIVREVLVQMGVNNE